MRQEIRLSIAGLGIIFYSPFAVQHIEEGEDYLSAHFQDPNDVAKHVRACEISTFCTGTPGDFKLVIDDGNLDTVALNQAEFRVRLGLEVREGQVCFRDLYELMEWSQECPVSQTVNLPDGVYRITVYSSRPASGISGDNQTVYLNFEKAEGKPELSWTGVPQLCDFENATRTISKKGSFVRH
jgi:hypothetical protein